QKECEQYATAMSKLDFNNDEEKEAIKDIFKKAIEVLIEDQSIGVHHFGRLPILKEVVELTFQEVLCKAMFASRTFAMGLKTPAKTIMSGRAGRRGKDLRGIGIIMIDSQMEMKTCQEVIQGTAASLVSTFHLSYYTLLNLMSYAKGQFKFEHVIRHSFHSFQHDKTLPKVEESIKTLETQIVHPFRISGKEAPVRIFWK
uniref:Exosome RNA helicase MTR4-like stalk domain-containing protein n=1 Tax=Physcomitrium patens TaxID=3218 RepID=A0A7I4EC59_PHYPA